MEKQPESEEDLLEHRTDGTDAFEPSISAARSSHSTICTQFQLEV